MLSLDGRGAFASDGSSDRDAGGDDPKAGAFGAFSAPRPRGLLSAIPPTPQILTCAAMLSRHGGSRTEPCPTHR